MHTILVVDDTKTNINILVELLGDEYDILVALDAKTAFEIIKEENIDLILLDIMMPEIDGFEVCDKLKKDPSTKNIPIIFITAKTDEESIEQAYDIGGSDYVTKPFKPKELLARVKRELQLQKLIKNLEFISSHDSMTGIYNRRKFFELAENQFAQNKQNIHAVMVDIDKFKNINDTYGHPIGDKVIKKVVSAIRKSLPKETIFGRLGGEEFAILLEDEQTENIVNLMEMIRKKIESLEIVSGNDKKIHFTISQGVARINESVQNIDQLLKNADDALYEAKGTGRNKVIFRV